MTRYILLITLILGGALALHAAPPDAKNYGGHGKADRFWTRTRISLTVLHGGTAAFDLQTTRRALHHGFRERNPLLRSIIGHGGWQGQARGIGWSLGLDLGISYLAHRLTKKGSPWRILKWELPLAMAGAHTVAGVYNYRLVNAHLRRMGKR